MYHSMSNLDLQDTASTKGDASQFKVCCSVALHEFFFQEFNINVVKNH